MMMKKLHMLELDWLTNQIMMHVII